MEKLRIEWDGVTEEIVLQKLAPDIIEYIEWYCENGLYLPDEFKRDPSTYTQILRYIQAVFIEIDEERILKNADEVAVHQKGLAYFYKYFHYFWR